MKYDVAIVGSQAIDLLRRSDRASIRRHGAKRRANAASASHDSGHLDESARMIGAVYETWRPVQRPHHMALRSQRHVKEFLAYRKHF